MADAKADGATPAPGPSVAATAIAMKHISKMKAHQNVGSLAERKRADRIDKIAAGIAASKSTPEWLKNLIETLRPILTTLVIMLDKASPYIIMACMTLFKFYQCLSSNISTALYGLVISFFGGAFPVAISVFEALRVSGGDRVVACLTDMYGEYQLFLEAEEEDNKKDENKDGIADVDQLSSQDLLSRKIRLALATVNPDRTLQAVGGITQAMAGALVVVKLQFAKTIALAVSISDNVQKPAARLLTPLLASALPQDLHKWIPVIITLGIKVVAMTFAWFIQRVLSAVHSAMMGGLMAGRGIILALNEHGYIKLDPEETMLDEILGWCIASLGIYFQFSNGLSLPFPLNVLLFPLSIAEYALQWVVTWS